LLFTLFAIDVAHIKKITIFVFGLLCIMIFGQILYGVDLLAIRELHRIVLLIIGFYIGSNFVDAFPSFKLALFIFIIWYLSIIFHPSVPFISDYFSSTTQFNHSYHFFRSIIPGGMPAASGYILSLFIIWSFISFKSGEINSPQLALTILLVLTLVIATQSRLPIALSFLFIVTLPIIFRIKLDTFLLACFILPVLLISYFFLSNTYDFSLYFDQRLMNTDSLQYRINSFIGALDILEEKFNRIFPGCLFVRDCHFNGSWNSVVTDGAVPYVLLNWGLPVTLLVFGYMYCLSFIHLYHLRFSMFFVVTIYAILSFLDPIFLDPKIGLLLSITVGFLSTEKISKYEK